MSTLADTALDARRAALRREETRTKAWRAIIVGAFFAVLIGSNLFVGAMMLMGTLQSRSDEAESAASARTGRISRTMLDGTFCRTMRFDNVLGQIADDKIVRCDELKDRRRGNTTFSWGKE